MTPPAHDLRGGFAGVAGSHFNRVQFPFFHVTVDVTVDVDETHNGCTHFNRAPTAIRTRDRRLRSWSVLQELPLVEADGDRSATDLFGLGGDCWSTFACVRFALQLEVAGDRIAPIDGIGEPTRLRGLRLALATDRA